MQRTDIERARDAEVETPQKKAARVAVETLPPGMWWSPAKGTQGAYLVKKSSAMDTIDPKFFIVRKANRSNISFIFLVCLCFSNIFNIF